MTDSLEELLESIEGSVSENGGWELPRGAHHLIFTPTGHLTVVHTKALHQWAAAVKEALSTSKSLETEESSKMSDFMCLRVYRESDGKLVQEYPLGGTTLSKLEFAVLELDAVSKGYYIQVQPLTEQRTYTYAEIRSGVDSLWSLR